MTAVNFRFATWNVNSVRIRLELLKKFVEAENPDILCLQEVKAKKEDFPFDEVRALGYPHIALYSQAGYNGVAILSKYALSYVEELNWVGKTDARHIKAVLFDEIELHNIYIPAGGDIPGPIATLTFANKLPFMEDVAEYWEQHKDEYQNKKMIICGDFNVAPFENDEWNHKQLLKIVSHTPVEIERLTRLRHSLDFVDISREFYPEPEKLYTWWSYRNPNWQTNNKGRRLDHIWVTPPLKNNVKSYKILTTARAWERPSDHVPVLADFAFLKDRPFLFLYIHDTFFQ